MKGLLEQLREYGACGYYPLHMPGHKRNMPPGTGLPEGVDALDITEIDGFDNLHSPEGVLKSAMEHAAGVFGAEETFFLVNGSTAGILTALSAVTRMGDRIIVARNCHKSVYHAIFLRQLEPVFLYPGLVEEWNIADAILPEQVETALDDWPDAAAVVITSPTYDGVIADIARIAEVAHSHGVLLIVDAAHGAHLGFGGGWPESPVRLGADLVIQSLHKTLPALTQTALLHVNGKLVDRERIRMFEGIYQTSSPSYLLMGSIDACVRQMEVCGKQRMEEFAGRLDRFERETEGLARLRRSDQSILCRGRMKGFDRGKLLITDRMETVRGNTLCRELLEHYRLQPEMAGDTCVTAIMTPWDREEGWLRLTRALWDLDHRILRRQVPEEERRLPEGVRSIPGLAPVRAVRLHEAVSASKRLCTLREAEGRTAGTFVNLYPPGIPLVIPGEILEEGLLSLLAEYLQQGLNVQGLEWSREKSEKRREALIPVLA